MMTKATETALNYELAGSGEAVILGHAGFVDSRMWDKQWETLTQQYRVLRYDMRGFGQSGAATEPTSRRHELYALLDEMDITAAHFVGSSLSGATFINIAIERPELVKSLVTINAVPNGYEMQGEPPRYLMEMFGAWQAGQFDEVSELQTCIWIDGSEREPDEVDADVREWAKTMNRFPVENMTMFIADSQPIDDLEKTAVTRLSEINCPVLVIDGALDHSAVHQASELMIAEIPDAKRITIDATAHMPMMEKPKEFEQILLDFLP